MERIRPHVGEKYHSLASRGLKIMILGESSYKPGGFPPTQSAARQTISLAEDAVGYDQGQGYWNKSRFYTRIARIFGYDAYDFVARKEFWSRISFYNYLQIVLPSARIAPHSTSWRDAQEPFLETVQELEPDFILSFSMRMWPHLPKSEDVTDVHNENNAWAKRACVFLMGGKTACLLGFKHPSSRGFYWESVRNIVKNQIDLDEFRSA